MFLPFYPPFFAFEPSLCFPDLFGDTSGVPVAQGTQGTVKYVPSYMRFFSKPFDWPFKLCPKLGPKR